MRAGNQIGPAGAASLGPSLVRMTQLMSLDLSGTLCDIGGSWRCGWMLANASNVPRWCVMQAEAVGGGAVAGGWACEGRTEGRRCAQAMKSKQLGQCHWHRVSEG